MPPRGIWKIRAMSFDDLDRVVVLEKAVFSSPWTVDLFLYELNHDERTVYLVAESEGELLGYVGAQVLDKEVHITNMAVEPRVRRRGLGSELMLECIRCGIERGARWVTLEVRLGNDEARDFYHKFGLEELGVRRNYYTDSGEDAVIMATGDIRSEDYTRLIEEIEGRLAVKGDEREC